MNAADDGFLRLPIFMVEDLAWLIGILEDWLLHASDDLADFAGNNAFTRPADQHGHLIRTSSAITTSPSSTRSAKPVFRADHH